MLVKNRDNQSAKEFDRLSERRRRRGFFGDLRLAAVFWVIVLAGLGFALGIRF